MEKTVQRSTMIVGSILALSMLAAGVPAASAQTLAVPPVGATTVAQDAPVTEAEWRQWSTDRIDEMEAIDWEQYALDRGCLYESGGLEIQVHAEANLEMGAPADMPLPVANLVLDCSERDRAATQGRGDVTPLATNWLNCWTSLSTLGGKLCIGKNGTVVEGEYTRDLNANTFSGFVNLYKRITTSADCSTSGQITNSIVKTIGGAGTLLAIAPNAPTNYRYSAYLWSKNSGIGSTRIGGVCTNI